MKYRKNRRKKLFFLALFLFLLFAAILNSKSILKLIYPIPYSDIIFAEAARNNVDPYLVAAIIKAESNFTSEAESRVGARGIMQIMPETGEWAAKKMKLKDFKPEDLYETKTNIKIGCWYLSNLNQEFNGNKILVVAAYNGGLGNVKEWLKNDKWSGEHATVDQIPFEETRLYVKKVLKAYSRYREIYVLE